MRILLVSPLLYGERVGKGGGVLCFGQLKCLAKSHEVHFLSFRERDLERPELDGLLGDLNAYCASVTTVERSIGRFSGWIARLQMLVRRYPADAWLARTGGMEEALARLLGKTQPDIVLIQFPPMAQYVECCGSVTTVMDVQDAFSVSGYREYLASRGTIKSILRLVAWFSWIRYESRYYSKFDQVIVLTEQDKHGLCVFSPGLAPFVSHAAVSTPAQRTRHRTAKNRIVFAGAFSHRPNADAVRFFLDEVYPSIAKSYPGVEFLAAGRNAPRDLLRRQSETIRFLGFVDDMSEFLEEATVVVVPLRFGGGIKIKTLEAMAHGCAIVSTSIGVEEIGASGEQEVLVSDATDQFASSVLRLLRDRQLREYLGENARKLIARKFGWEVKARSMEVALRDARSRRILSRSVANGRPA